MSASGYATLNTSGTITGYTLTNPVSISIRNAAGNTTDQIQAARTTTAGKLLATDIFAQSSYITWTKNIYDSTGKQTATWQYISIPASGTGSSGTNYIAMPINSSEDVSNNTTRSVAPDGTITRTVYDWRNNPIQTWIGTNDTGATDANPAGNGGSNNMKLISEREYGMSGGCGTCTGEKDKVRVEVLHPDDTNTRVTEYQYDWRGRQIRSINDRDQNNKITYSLTTYDNLDRVIKSEQFLTIENGTSSGSPLWGANNPADDRLLARSETFYDERGHRWKTVQSIANPTTGVVTGNITSQNWYDAAGHVIKTWNSASPRYTKTMYDSLGNAFKSYVVTGTESGYAAATTLTNNTVLSQSETVYDLAGNAMMTASAERLWNQTAKGALTLTTGRFNYSAQWLDPAGRTFASADYGTNNGTALTRPATVPTSSATVRVSKTNYDVNTGRVTSTIDPGGRITQQVYDGLGRAYKTILPKPDAATAAPEYVTEFDTLGRTVAQKDPLGNKTQTIYGKFGRVDATLDAKSNRTEYTYNRLGELISQKDPMNRVTQFVYDDLGRRIQIIQPKPTTTAANPVQQTKYNEHGLVAQEIDPLGNITRMEYDGLGRITAKVDALNGRTEYTYDSEGKMLTLKDPVGNITTYTYDDAMRVLQEKNALNKIRYFEYLASGMVSKKTDRNGRIVTYTYDRFGNMTNEKWYSSSSALERTLTFTYDTLGRLTTFTDPSGTQTMTYDDGGRNTQTVMQLTGLTSVVTFANTFDIMNRRTTLATKVGTTSDFANTWTYDANSQVTSIVQQTQSGNTVNPKRIDYVYNTANQQTTKTGYAAITTGSKVYDTSFTYDGMGRLTNLAHKRNTTTLAAYTFGWDAASRITDFDFTHQGHTGTKTSDYAYDDTDQLTGASYNSFLSNESYQYDANGNRTNNNFTTGTNNQLTSDGTFNYTYDSEGNRLTKKLVSTGATTTYTWDHRNRLTKVVTPSATVEYAYDHLNRMTKRGSEIFIHDGYQIVLVLNASGTVQNRCFWGASQDKLIAEEKSGAVLWTLCDHLGSVRDVVNNTGASLNHLEYNAFGKLISQSNAYYAPTFRYTGKMTDDATDLQWNINRWYDANVGRWISEDPLSFDAGDGNLYRYVGNLSSILRDYLGLEWHKKTKILAQTYEADEDGDSLEDLAQKVTGNSKDWVCIWPIVPHSFWQSYPYAKKCAKADASNLKSPQNILSTMRSFKTMPEYNVDVIGSDISDQTMNLLAVQRVLKIADTDRWKSGADAAQKIMNAARMGASPLDELVIAGHHGFGFFAGNWYNPRLFHPFSILFLAANNGIGDNNSNDFNHASKRQGPPRCWLRHNAKIWGVGCDTHPIWSGLMANILARSAGTGHFSGVSVMGSSEKIYGDTHLQENGKYTPPYLYVKSNPKTMAKNFPQVKKWKMWVSTPGSV